MRTFILFFTAWVNAASALSASEAQKVVTSCGVKGGFVVVVGCQNPDFLAGLRLNEAYLVQGLDRRAEAVKRARERVAALGLLGPVTCTGFDGRHLPYVNDIVNLLVVLAPGKISGEEILRVLAPGGVAVIQEGSTWKEIRKKRPPDVDEWTHFLHDASGNAVARDQRVGPPKRLRWLAGPRWCRSHEIPTSVQGVVTAGGRIFAIIDEAPIGVYRRLPQRCMLVARDAANGVLLWKVPLRGWQPELGTGQGGRWSIHHTIPRRLVASGDRLYVTLRFRDSPVSVLNAATGKMLLEKIEGTTGADELILSAGVLCVKIPRKRFIGATEQFTKAALHDTLVGVDAQSGKVLWRKEGIRVIPYAFSAASGRLVYHDMESLTCCDIRSGKELWRTALPIERTVGGGSTLVIADGVVLFHGWDRSRSAKRPRRGGFFLTALSLADGTILWKRPGRRGLAGACTQPTDLFVTGDVVWLDGSQQGLDLRSGKVRKTLTLGHLVSPGHHYRCHRSKATVRFLIWPKRGAEFVDIEGGDHMRNDWLRAPCFTGLVPANGLLYVPPNQCFCYPGVKIPGFLALSAEKAETPALCGDSGLVRGEAFGAAIQPQVAGPQDWPAYRHDPQRSGWSPAALPKELALLWKKKFTAPLTQAVAVGGRVWIVERRACRLRCLSAETGEDLWRFLAAGPVDSPPAIYRGRCIFGCRDGSVYCLRCEDGALVWRRRLAPDRRLVAEERVESVWPVSGSVLVHNDVAYCAAGRSSFLDGGVLLCGLSVTTGALRYHHVLSGPWPDIGRDVGKPFAMEGAMPDLFVTDGRFLYMGRVKFDMQLRRVPLRWGSDLGELDMGGVHLVSTGGFLDDSGFDRLFWMYSRWWPGFYFAQHAPKSGQLVVFDDQRTYAVKYFYRRVIWSPAFFPGEKGYLLYADSNDTEPVLLEKRRKDEGLRWLPEETYRDRYRRGGRGVEKGTGFVRLTPPLWKRFLPVRIRAMVLAGDRLVAGGPPDVVHPKDPLAAFEGRAGGKLLVLSAQGGSLLREYSLESEPIFDGLSAARGKLYLVCRDGVVMCFGSRTR